LKKLKDAAGLIRTWIDKGIAEEFGKGEDPVSISKRITALQTEITRLHDSPEYVRARAIRQRGIEYYSEVMKALDSKDYPIALTESGLSGDWTGCLIKEAEGIYCAGWTRESLAEYLDNNNLIPKKHYDDDGVAHLFYDIPKELAQAIVSKMIEAHPAEVKVAEGYEKQIEALKAEVEALRKKLTEQT
jgi:cell division protein FtsB